MRLRTTGGVSAATQSPPETTSPGWHGSEEKTIGARAAAHGWSSPDLNAGQGRPLQTRVVRGRSDVPRWQREPDAPERIAINLGPPPKSMRSATFQSAAWDWEPFRWRLVLAIAATNPVAGL